MQYRVDPAYYVQHVEAVMQHAGLSCATPPGNATCARMLKRRHRSFPGGAPRPMRWTLSQPGNSELRAGVAHKPPAECLRRMQTVVNMTRRAWAAYTTHALGHDELLPVSRTFRDWTPGQPLAVTLIDGLDTLFLMGLVDEFRQAVAFLQASDLHIAGFGIDADVPVFEVTIRMLGGLLSAYALSGEEVLLSLAYDLGDRLWWAVADVGTLADRSSQAKVSCAREIDHTSQGVDDDDDGRGWVPPIHRWRRIPTANVHLRCRRGRHPHWLKGRHSLAEVTSLQLEWRSLSFYTGDARFDIAARRIMDTVLRSGNDERGAPDGLWPLWIDAESGTPLWGAKATERTVSIGARSDSFYEYLCKQLVQFAPLPFPGGRDRVGGRSPRHQRPLVSLPAPRPLSDHEILLRSAWSRSLFGIQRILLVPLNRRRPPLARATADALLPCRAFVSSVQRRVEDDEDPTVGSVVTHQRALLAEVGHARDSTMDASSHWLYTFSMEHLACFVVGPLTLWEEFAGDEATAAQLVTTARAVARTCHAMYGASPLGVGPETIILQPPADVDHAPLSPASRSRDCDDDAGNPSSPANSASSSPLDWQFIPSANSFNRLRPEAIEAMYYLARRSAVSAKLPEGPPPPPSWADMAWDMISALDRYASLDHGGFAGLINVFPDPLPNQSFQSSAASPSTTTHLDVMDSFFISETLKYAYLAVSRTKSTMAAGSAFPVVRRLGQHQEDEHDDCDVRLWMHTSPDSADVDAAHDGGGDGAGGLMVAFPIASLFVFNTEGHLLPRLPGGLFPVMEIKRS